MRHLLLVACRIEIMRNILLASKDLEPEIDKFSSLDGELGLNRQTRMRLFTLTPSDVRELIRRRYCECGGQQRNYVEIK